MTIVCKLTNVIIFLHSTPDQHRLLRKLSRSKETQPGPLNWNRRVSLFSVGMLVGFIVYINHSLEIKHFIN